MSLHCALGRAAVKSFAQLASAKSCFVPVRAFTFIVLRGEELQQHQKLRTSLGLFL